MSSQQMIFEWGVDCLSWDVDEMHGIEVPLPYGYRLVSVLPFPYSNTSINSLWQGDDAEVKVFLVDNLADRIANGGSPDPKQSSVTIYVKRTANVNSSCSVTMWLLLEKGNMPITKIQYNSPDPS